MLKFKLLLTILLTFVFSIIIFIIITNILNSIRYNKDYKVIEYSSFTDIEDLDKLKMINTATPPALGYIPDAKTAIKIAESVIKPYNKGYFSTFIVGEVYYVKDRDCWQVNFINFVGSSGNVVMNKTTGEIVCVWFEKA